MREWMGQRDQRLLTATEKVRTKNAVYNTITLFLNLRKVLSGKEV